MGIVHERQQLVEVLLHEGANLPVRQPFGGGINRQHESGIALRVVARFGEHDELARHNLLPVVIAHRPRHEQQLAFLDLTLEKWPAGPGALEQAARILEHRVKHAQSSAPRLQHARADDAAHARHLLIDRGARQRRDGRGVEIAMGNEVEQIAGGANAESLEGFGALRADAF